MENLGSRSEPPFVWPTDRIRHCLDVLVGSADFEDITFARFRELIELYPEHVGGWVQELDVARFKKIPSACQSREDKFINKSELRNLAEWMYKRDSRRTKMEQLRNRDFVDMNHERDIIEATREAFREYSKYKYIPHAISYLESIKGVGLKMATLTLASAFPAEVPFFSHELFEWACPDYKGQTKETYEQLHKRVNKFIDRLCKDGNHVTAVEVEKVAFVAMASKHMQAKRLQDGSMRLDRKAVLGHGGGCEGVFKGCLQRETAVAVKVVSGMKAHVRYLQALDEITMLATLQKDQFVDFHGWLFLDGHFHLAMELMCYDLETYLYSKHGQNMGMASWKDKEPLTPLQRPIRQLIIGLESLHARGIVHRDLRPKNIFLDARGNVKIGDFGISKRVVGGHDPAAIAAPETWGYTAPEMVRAAGSSELGLAVSTKVDVWSLGCILYRMLVGKPLFTSAVELKVELEFELRTKLKTLDALYSWRFGITRRVIPFLKALLCEDPARRIDIQQARNDKWMVGYNTS